MNILRTAGRTAVKQSPSQPVRRPVTEKWSVGGERGTVDLETFESTADLVDSDIRKHGREAVYQFESRTANDRNNLKDRSSDIFGGALMGAAAGGGIAIPFVLIGGFMNTLAPRMFIDPGVALMGGAAVIGGVVGGVSALMAGSSPSTGEIKGVLQEKGENLEFYPYQRINTVANLNDYQSATVPEADDTGMRDYGRQWWN